MYSISVQSGHTHLARVLIRREGISAELLFMSCSMAAVTAKRLRKATAGNCVRCFPTVKTPQLFRSGSRGVESILVMWRYNSGTWGKTVGLKFSPEGGQKSPKHVESISLRAASPVRIWGVFDEGATIRVHKGSVKLWALTGFDFKNFTHCALHAVFPLGGCLD